MYCQAVITVDSNPMITTRVMEVRTGAYYLIGKILVIHCCFCIVLFFKYICFCIVLFFMYVCVCIVLCFMHICFGIVLFFM